MKKKLIWALPALLLVFGLMVVSCDDGSETKKDASIPVELQGTYLVAGYVMVVNANGSGTIDGAACTFSVADPVLTVKLGADTITVNYSVGANGVIIFTNVEDKAGYLKNVFSFIAAADPVKPEQAVTKPAIIPDALVGAWGNSTVSAIFVINADGTGTTYNTSTTNSDACLWSVNSNKLTLSVNYGSTFGTLICTFDYAIAGGNQLTISNPVTDTSQEVGNLNLSENLKGYTAFSPFNKGAIVSDPDIGSFVWRNAIPSEFTGTWSSAGVLPIFNINADGTGTTYIGSTPSYNADSTFSMTSDKTKIKITVSGFGGVMYDCAIADGALSITDPVLATDASTGLGLYLYFNPLTK